MTVVKGRTTVLDCPIQGIPFPNVTWTRNGETLTRDSRMTLLYGGRHLELSMATESDAAKYACTGSNEAGEMTLSFNVTVVGKCIFVDLRLLTGMTMVRSPCE